MNNLVPAGSPSSPGTLLPVAIDYPAALALRQMALVQDELPKYLLAPEVSALLHYVPDLHRTMLLATLWNKPVASLGWSVIEALLNGETWFRRDRAVFDVTDDGLVLGRIAPGHAEEEIREATGAPFTTELEAKNRSQATLTAYRCDLAQFVAFLKQTNYTADVAQQVRAAAETAFESQNGKAADE